MQALDVANAIAAAHKDVPGGLLPALHGIQDALGHVPAEAVPAIAGQFNLSRAEVHGVVSYYHHFRSAPAGRLLVQVCRAEACKAMGADALLDHAAAHLGCEVHGTTADGRSSLEPVFCLGLCASSPAMAINGEVHARLTPARFDAIVAAADAAAPARAAS
ncbi:formate dehydrogenase subunit gamma [Variovorax sp. TBS-050B]|jgi:formate dehydrogenase subunit gamma|uniref:formate dehydrogenase subunit gamma n=1 Tax=Variovorax sp. TBS-050B TaxID=2940551 RepID=UPI002475C98B|nr:formate dehydrogenase subunit gamma [Variovorax sp. TBS-050B]MDH6594140.1 formate dehydrogenase subunit gamma [Variovorax sp. TBS-050B]